MLFNITYSVPYEGDCILHDMSVEEVIAWLSNTCYDYIDSARIVPAGQIWYDASDFIRKFA